MRKKPHFPVHFRKRFLAGSPLNAPEPASAQERSPVEQARAEADMICEILLHRKGQRTEHSAREQFNLTRREIADLLDRPGVATALSSSEQNQYQQLAAGNLSEADLAKEITANLVKEMKKTVHGIEDIEGLEASVKEDLPKYIQELETKVIRRFLFLGGRLEQRVRIETDAYDQTMDADRAADERDIAASEGAAIGGSIISGEKRFGNRPGTTFRPGKGITSFEKGGKIRTVSGGAPDHDLTGGDVGEHDDYSEDSSA
jgi:hypothetical protein